MPNRLRTLDLFSGIGGIGMGLEATDGFEVKAHSEISEYCCAVLKRHWPDVPNLGDISQVKDTEIGTIDVICGGFPCQDISLANSGSMSGIDGAKSGLWFEFFKQIQRHNPTFVVIENSPVLRSKGLDRILAGLQSVGLDAEWHCIPCTAVDAPHSRDRVWVIAYPAGLGNRLPEGQVLTRRHFVKHVSQREAEPALCRVDDGLPNQSHMLRALGNSASPEIAKIIGYSLLDAVEFIKT